MDNKILGEYCENCNTTKQEIKLYAFCYDEDRYFCENCINKHEEHKKECEILFPSKRPRGRPKKIKLSKEKSIIGRPKGKTYDKKIRYILKFNNNTYECYNISSMAKITNCSHSAIVRLLTNVTKFTDSKSNHLKDIKIERINQT